MKKIATVLAAGVMSLSLASPAQAFEGEIRQYAKTCTTANGYKAVVILLAKQDSANTSRVNEVTTVINKVRNGKFVRIPAGTSGSFAADAERLRPPRNLPANLDYAEGKWKRTTASELQVGPWFPKTLTTRSVYGNRIKTRVTIKEAGKPAYSCKPAEIAYSNKFS